MPANFPFLIPFNYAHLVAKGLRNCKKKKKEKHKADRTHVRTQPVHKQGEVGRTTALWKKGGTLNDAILAEPDREFANFAHFWQREPH